ncbi:hypothetical protein FISHEDRAFT_55815 [Fistulina hepatica ATCC 64428]|uniref:Uncharacterized protein n=1 Tax=Fistulina hepatica ATCC 64428 TaxID=1128425 RepID=A0A0D7ALI3_9AGAR|nr:hypothetical protein FISHEDRAFT_55815 [Fistulina hepatica ATCC 64428]
MDFYLNRLESNSTALTRRAWGKRRRGLAAAVLESSRGTFITIVGCVFLDLERAARAGDAITNLASQPHTSLDIVMLFEGVGRAANIFRTRVSDVARNAHIRWVNNWNVVIDGWQLLCEFERVPGATLAKSCDSGVTELLHFYRSLRRPPFCHSTVARLRRPTHMRAIVYFRLMPQVRPSELPFLDMAYAIQANSGSMNTTFGIPSGIDSVANICQGQHRTARGFKYRFPACTAIVESMDSEAYSAGIRMASAEYLDLVCVLPRVDWAPPLVLPKTFLLAMAGRSMHQFTAVLQRDFLKTPEGELSAGTSSGEAAIEPQGRAKTANLVTSQIQFCANYRNRPRDHRLAFLDHTLGQGTLYETRRPRLTFSDDPSELQYRTRDLNFPLECSSSFRQARFK